MNKVTPVEARKQLQAAKEMTKQGIRFVPIPVLNDKEADELITLKKSIRDFKKLANDIKER